MKQYVKRCLALMLSFAMAVTMLPSSVARAAGEGQAAGTTQTIACSKFVRAGAQANKTGTNGKNAALVAVAGGAVTVTGSAEGAAKDADTATGGAGLGSSRVAAMGFVLPGKKTTDSEGGIDPELISHAEVTITVADTDKNLGNGKMKAAIYQVDSSKYQGLQTESAIAGSTFPAKDGYTKDKTVFSGGLGGTKGWITYQNKIQDLKVSFDVTDWIKEAVSSGDAYAVYRMQAPVAGYYVYMDDAGDNAPKLSITTLSETEVIAQVKADIKVPSEARANFILPTTGVCGSTIGWTSSDPAITISDSDALVDRSSEEDKDVTLTAEIVRGKAKDTVTYQVKVPKRVAGEAWATFDFNNEAADNKFTSGSVEAVIAGNGTNPKLEDRDQANGKALYLDGTAKWLNLQYAGGGSLLTGLEELTISFDAKPDRTGTNWGFYAAPNDAAQTNGKEHYIGALINNGSTKIERYNNTSGRPVTVSAATGTEWSHVDVVFEEDATVLYVDGKRMGSAASSYRLTDILGADSIFQIGKANWGNGEYYKGWMDNLTLYDQALTPVQLCDGAELERLVSADEGALAVPTEAKKDFDLPSKGENGSAIHWSVPESNGCIAVQDGKAEVTRPEDADKTVILTAEISIGNVKRTKEFPVKVIKKLNVEENIRAALAGITIPNQNDIRDNITLPVEVQAEGEDAKVTVTWESKNKNVITDSKANKQEAGMVTRPQQDTEVELVATGSLEGKKDTRSITVTVKAQKEIGKKTSYLFAHFTGTEGRATDEQIYFATSENGSQWLDMTTNGKPVLSSDLGDKGVRDPFLLRSHNGDKFWLIATDLSIYHRGGWNKAQATSKGSTKLVIWESADLVNWGEPRLVDIASRIPGAGCAWAPEAYYDPETGNYVVYWATASDESNEIGDRMNMYYCTTRDFYTFTEPVLWIDRQHSIIDTTMIYDDTSNMYYRASGDGQITIEKSASIYDGWEIVTTLKDIFNNDKYSGAMLEGPEFFEYCEDDWLKDTEGNPKRTWGLMCDQYNEGKGYLPFRTTSLGDKTTASWSSATDVNFGSLKKRHGTILPVTDEEYKAVMQKFGYLTGDEEIEEKVLADFDFDEEKDFGEGKKGFESENAKAEGTYTLKSSYDKEAGKALYLDGSSNFLNVTDKDGSSLLKGLKELTISYEFKPDRSTDANWVLYAAPDSTAPVYNKERYLGVMEKGGKTTLERYNNSGKRPTNPQAETGSTWRKIDIVLTETDSTIYVNGKKASTEESAYQLSYILGGSSILQIGKANWGDKGEYCKGWIDNLRIVNKASTEAEIQAASGNFADRIPLEVISATVGTAPDHATAINYRGTDDHTAITSLIDADKKEIQPYVRKGTDLTKIPVSLALSETVDSMKIGETAFTNGAKADLSKDVSLALAKDGKTTTWTLKKPVISNNPVLPGQYADPDIDYFDGRFWIYPTTDGFPSWSGTVFHAFSSPDMVNWEDEGIIMELANSNPGKNDKGVQIAKSPWAVKGSAWAPTIEKKNGKYYFYYCGKESSGASAVGVAVADHPAGPYTDKGTALVTKKMTDDAGVGVGQAIDPSIFTDDDGKSYILLGNGSAVIAELNDDMMSIKEGTLKRIQGLTGFRESVIVTKAGGKYHWTWTCDDANSPNYHVSYGISDKLFEDDGSVKVTLKEGNLLVKNESKNILGSGHQSVVHVKDAENKDRYFMAYHRFYTPLNIFTSGDGLGKHRETCIDEITFDANGDMKIAPTLEGLSAVKVQPQVIDDGKGNIEIEIQDIAPGQEGTAVVEIPASAADSIKKVQGTEASIVFNIPKNMDGKVGTINLPKELLQAAKEAGKNLAISVNGSNSYSWSFSKESLAAAQLADLNLALDVDSEKDAEVKKLLADDQDGMVLSFAQQGAIPTAKVTVGSKDGWKAGDKVTLSYYNPQTKSLEKMQEYTVGADGKVVVDITKGGKYVLWKQIAVVKQINLNKTSLALVVGGNETLTATVVPADAINREITWSSDNDKVATVDQKGKVTAKAAGTANITAKTANGVSAACKVTVSPAKISVKSVKLNKTKLTLGVGEKFTLKAAVDPGNATNKKVTWKLSKNKIVTIKNGKITAKKKGTVKVTATADGKTSKACTITVKAAPDKKAKITLNKKKVTLSLKNKKKKTFQIKAKISSKKYGCNGFKYTVDKKGKKAVKVDANGKVTAKKKGTATITVKPYNGKGKAAKLKVTVK